MRLRVAALLVCLTIVLPQTAQAQSNPDSSLVHLAQPLALSLGTLVQVDAFAGRDGRNDGFEARAARLRLDATTGQVNVFIQTELRNAVSLFDLRVRIPVGRRHRLSAGLYKTPFSLEFIRYRGALRTIERSRVVNALAPQRDVGLDWRTRILPDALTVQVGVYNGSGVARTNDDNQFLYVARASGQMAIREAVLEWGVNGAYSNDTNAPVPVVPGGQFSGTRQLLGADLDVTMGRLLLAGEVIAGDFDTRDGADQTALGGFVTGGISLTTQHRVILRYDTFDPGRPGTTSPDQIRLGYDFFATDRVRLETEVGAPLDDVTDASATLRLQVSAR